MSFTIGNRVVVSSLKAWIFFLCTAAQDWSNNIVFVDYVGSVVLGFLPYRICQHLFQCSHLNVGEKQPAFQPLSLCLRCVYVNLTKNGDKLGQV